MFRPIARVMLRAGISWRELSDVLKTTYVEVATEDFGIRGRPTNISRVAILTGLTRKEVRRLRDLLEDMGYTVAYNLDRSETDPGRFERRATNTRMPAKAVPAFREFIEIEGQAFLERVDAWLSEHELEDSDDSKSVRLGLGAYWIEGRKRED